jgi:hypothetical protein
VADADLQVTGRADRSGTTSGAFLALAGRATGGDSYYAATINLVGNTFSIRYWTGFWQTISSVTGPSPAFTANTDYSIRFQLQGNSLRAKWWLAGQPEPAAWTIQTTNTDQTRPSAGQSGVVAAVGAASTTVNFAFDDFLAVPLVGGASGQSGVPAAPTDSPTTVRVWIPIVIGDTQPTAVTAEPFAASVRTAAAPAPDGAAAAETSPVDSGRRRIAELWGWLRGSG